MVQFAIIDIPLHCGRCCAKRRTNSSPINKGKQGSTLQLWNFLWESRSLHQ
jgi:hypothetical protein